MGSLRDRLLAGGKVPKGEVTVTTADGEQLTVEVRGLTQAARGVLMNTCMKTNQETGENEGMDVAKMQPELLLACAYDPTTGKKLFERTDMDVIGELSADYLDPIISKATQLSGMSKDAVTVAVGNSSVTPTA